MISKRIWKAGALAVAVTLTFAVFAFRIEEWSKGLETEFLVYGQTAGTGTGSAAGGTGTAATVTKVLPQIVAGSYDGGLSKYVTVIQILNTGASSINVTGNFYNTNGTPSTLAMTTNIASAAVANGSLASTALAPNAALVIRVENAAAGTTNWARITSTGNTLVSSYFELRDGATNVLYTRVGTPASAADLSHFVIPRVRNTASGLDVGFALVNTGTTTASITVTAKDSTGATLGARVYTMAPGAHTASFANQFLSATGCSPCLAGEAAGTNYGFLVFESTSAQFAAVSLAVEGAALSSFPIGVLQ